MSALAERLRDWPERLASLARELGVPGASLGVLAGDEVFATACGVVNARTGVEAAPDAVFQMGSITKVFTTTLVMQLVDEGRLALDAPVVEALPEFELADAAAARRITLRHLLTHASGIDGDQFVDTGRGEDAIERFVAHLRGVGLVHEPGERFSYCNAGFVIAGRIVECLRGTTYDRALRERLLAPLGLHATGTLPEQALLHRAAIGHWRGADGAAVPVPVWCLNPSNAPAGATPFTTARDLLGFARFHLDDGVAPDGTRRLEAASAQAMRARQRELHGTAGEIADAWGLGWLLRDARGGTLVAHSGLTIGQAAWLDVSFERRVAVALLTNGGDWTTLAARVRSALLAELADVTLPALASPDASVRVEAARHLGVYERSGARIEVVASAAAPSGLGVKIRAIWHSLAPDPPALPLVATGRDRFRVSLPHSASDAVVGFSGNDPAGRARYLEMHGRAHPRH